MQPYPTLPANPITDPYPTRLPAESMLRIALVTYGCALSLEPN